MQARWQAAATSWRFSEGGWGPLTIRPDAMAAKSAGAAVQMAVSRQAAAMGADACQSETLAGYHRRMPASRSAAAAAALALSTLFAVALAGCASRADIADGPP